MFLLQPSSFPVNILQYKSVNSGIDRENEKSEPILTQLALLQKLFMKGDQNSQLAPHILTNNLKNQEIYNWIHFLEQLSGFASAPYIEGNEYYGTWGNVDNLELHPFNINNVEITPTKRLYKVLFRKVIRKNLFYKDLIWSINPALKVENDRVILELQSPEEEGEDILILEKDALLEDFLSVFNEPFVILELIGRYSPKFSEETIRTYFQDLFDNSIIVCQQELLGDEISEKSLASLCRFLKIKNPSREIRKSLSNFSEEKTAFINDIKGIESIRLFRELLKINVKQKLKICTLNSAHRENIKKAVTLLSLIGTRIAQGDVLSFKENIKKIHGSTTISLKELLASVKLQDSYLRGTETSAPQEINPIVECFFRKKIEDCFRESATVIHLSDKEIGTLDIVPLVFPKEFIASVQKTDKGINISSLTLASSSKNIIDIYKRLKDKNYPDPMGNAQVFKYSTSLPEISDIYVCIHKEILEIKDINGTTIDFSQMRALLKTLDRSSKAYEMMVLFIKATRMQKIVFSWGQKIGKDYNYLPRVVYNTVILAQAIWKIQKPVSNFDLNNAASVKLWREQRGIPRYVEILGYEKHRFIDFENEYTLLLFFEILDGQSDVFIQEILHLNENALIDNNRQIYNHDILMHFYFN